MRNPAFLALLDEIKALHESKNHDYAEDADPLSNLRRAEAMGIPAWKGVLVRLTDKWSRIEQLANGKSPKHESLRDSLIDNAVYSLLCVLLLEESTRERSGADALSLPSQPPTSDRLLPADTEPLSWSEPRLVSSGMAIPAPQVSATYPAPGSPTRSERDVEQFSGCG